MTNAIIQARVSASLKEEAEAVLRGVGLKPSEAIRLFLQQVVNVGGLPFQPTGSPLPMAVRAASSRTHAKEVGAGFPLSVASGEAAIRPQDPLANFAPDEGTGSVVLMPVGADAPRATAFAAAGSGKTQESPTPEEEGVFTPDTRAKKEEEAEKTCSRGEADTTTAPPLPEKPAQAPYFTTADALLKGLGVR